MFPLIVSIGDMHMVDIVVQELEGDEDTENVYLVTPKSAVPATTVTAAVVDVAPGLSFLVVSGDAGGTPLAQEELEGDSDTDNMYLVTPKTLLADSAAPGTALTGYTFNTAQGPVLLVQLPGAA